PLSGGLLFWPIAKDHFPIPCHHSDSGFPCLTYSTFRNPLIYRLLTLSNIKKECFSASDSEISSYPVEMRVPPKSKNLLRYLCYLLFTFPWHKNWHVTWHNI